MLLLFFESCSTRGAALQYIIEIVELVCELFLKQQAGAGEKIEPMSSEDLPASFLTLLRDLNFDDLLSNTDLKNDVGKPCIKTRHVIIARNNAVVHANDATVLSLAKPFASLREAFDEAFNSHGAVSHGAVSHGGDGGLVSYGDTAFLDGELLEDVPRVRALLVVCLSPWSADLKKHVIRRPTRTKRSWPSAS
jgi:hypothetical protein